MAYKGEDATWTGPVVERGQVKAYFTPLTLSASKPEKARAIRAILALQKGGKCNGCQDVVQNYANLYRWHFDHLHPLVHYKHSPDTGILQFRISGTDIANRTFDLVVRHAVQDTQLLCSRCHFAKSQADRGMDDAAAKFSRDVFQSL